MVLVNIIKTLGIASVKTIYPKILFANRIKEIRLNNKSYFSVIDKTNVTSYLELNKVTATLSLLSFPILFLTEGLQCQNFKTSLYSRSLETVSDSWVWSLVCWPLDHWDMFDLTQYIVHIKFLQWNPTGILFPCSHAT